MSQRIRLAHKAMADSRAMEEEAERMNPIVGRGATPSMGLSQFRGGAKKKMLGRTLGKRIAKMEAESPSMAQTEMDAMAVMPSGEYDGAGMRSEAMVQGRHLGEHLHKLHGGAYMKEFHEGMGMAMPKSGGAQTGAYEGEGKMEGGFLGALASMAIPLIGSLFGKGEMKKSAHNALVKHFSKKPRSKKPELEGGFWGSLLSAAVPLIGSLFGKGAMSKKAHDDLVAMVKKHEGKGMKGGMARMVGSGELTIHHSGGMEMESEEECEMPSPKAPKKKRVVGATDGRRKRAEIVRKVMAEKGMKMIEASKYVKEHGLY
jgi:hypothetical protein